LEEEDTGIPLLGFDLRVFHPVLGEVLHNTDMAEYALLDMKKTLKNTRKDATLEDADRELEESRRREKEKARLKDTHDDSDNDDRDGGKRGDDDDGVDATGNRRSFRARYEHYSFCTISILRLLTLNSIIRAVLCSVNFKSRGFEVTKQDTLRSMRSDLLKDRLLNYDDSESVAESIVTGNSEHSSLRIDALYYTQTGRTRDPRSYTNNNADWENVSQLSEPRGKTFYVIAMGILFILFSRLLHSFFVSFSCCPCRPAHLTSRPALYCTKRSEQFVGAVFAD